MSAVGWCEVGEPAQHVNEYALSDASVTSVGLARCVRLLRMYSSRHEPCVGSTEVTEARKQPWLRKYDWRYASNYGLQISPGTGLLWFPAVRGSFIKIAQPLLFMSFPIYE
jgi:hypothetical protein